MGDLLAKGRLLNQQGRFKEAEAIYRQALLREEYDRLDATTGLALSLLGQDRFVDADKTAADALSQDPDRAYTHYLRAMILRYKGGLKQAEDHARTALRGEPWNGNYNSELAWILLRQGKSTEAHAVTTAALRADPYGLNLLQAHTQAQMSIGLNAEAGQTARRALSMHAEDSLSLTQLARTLLRTGEREEAEQLALQALRVDPTYGWARSVLLQCLQQRYWFYRLVAAYSRTFSRLTRAWNWKVALPIFLGLRILSFLGPIGAFLLVLLFLTAMLMWMLRALTILSLRLHPLGRAALTKVETQRSNVIAALLTAALGSLAGFALTGSLACWKIGLVLTALLVPVSAALSTPGRIPRILSVPAVVLAALAAWAVIDVLFGHDQHGGMVAGTACILLSALFAFLVPPLSFDD